MFKYFDIQNRGFVNFEQSAEYLNVFLKDITDWANLKDNDVNCINCNIPISKTLFKNE
jgi:hypothetical protein